MSKKTPFYTKTYRYSGAIIRRYNSAFQAEINLPGRRLRKSFPTLDRCKGWIDLKRVELHNEGVKALALTDRQKQEAVRAIELLGSVPLTTAAAFWVKHHKPAGGTKTVDELFREYIEAKRKRNLRARSLSTIRTNIGRVVQDFPEKPVHTFTAGDIEGWLDDREYEGTTRGNQIRYLHGFFAYAVKQGLIEGNPVAGIERPRRDESLPGIFAVADVEGLLKTAGAGFPDMLPFFAVGFFAGLRTAELDRLNWEDVDLDGKLITVRPEVAKRRRQRHVDIGENLCQLLAGCVKPKGRVCPGESARKRRLSAILAACGVKWVPNGMRHSFASYHLARYQDAARTALQLGHVSPVIVFDHYRNLVKSGEARRYWSLTV